MTSSPFVCLVKWDYNLGIIASIGEGADSKVCFHGFHPADSILCFSVGTATFSSVMLVVVDIGFAGGRLGLRGGCSGRTVGGDAVVNVTTRGRGFIIGVLGCDVKDGGKQYALVMKARMLAYLCTDILELFLRTRKGQVGC